jgi:hypothetical protein
VWLRQELIAHLPVEAVQLERTQAPVVLLPASNGHLGSAILAGQRAPVAVSDSKSQ